MAGGVLVILKDLAGLFQVEDLAVGVVLEGIEEGGRGLGEEDALAPAGGHGGGGRRAGTGEMMGGRKGRGEGGGQGAAGG